MRRNKDVEKNRDDNIYIVYITDNNYVMPTIVSIISLLHNKKKETKIEINVIGVDLSEDSKGNFNKIRIDKNYDNFSLKLIDKTDSLSSLQIENLHVSTAALFKFYLPDLFPNYDKILYLDSDMLVLNDLSELYKTDIELYYAGVVKDIKSTTYSPSQLIKLGLQGKHRAYFNSGMMLLNLNRMRKDMIPSKLLDYRKNGINYFMDQDALNVVFEDEVIYLPFKYNCIYRVLDILGFENCKAYYEFNCNNKEEIINSAVVLHLASPVKPWEHYIDYLSEIFEFYYRKSIYANKVLEVLDNDKINITDNKTSDDKEVHVVYICDNRTVKNMCISLSSLLANKNLESKYIINLYLCNVTNYNRDLIKSYKKNCNDKITINIEEVKEYDYMNIYDYLGVAIPISILTLFTLPNKYNFNKVIYLGNNTIILNDLSTLYSVDLGNKYIAAVKDYHAEVCKPPMNKKLYLNHDFYFQTDVMVMNLDKMRKDNISNELINYKKYGINYYAIQDTFNVCMKENVMYLPLYYNYMTYLDDINDKIIQDYYEILPFFSYDELISRVVVLNMNGKKPWEKNQYIISELFYHYLKNTPFKEQFVLSDEVKCIGNILLSGFLDKNKLKQIELEKFKLMPKMLNNLLIKPISLKFENEIENYWEKKEISLNYKNRDKKIIVSLTTIPKRLDAAIEVIKRMMTQTMLPDLIILNLGKEFFGDVELPEELIELQQKGVTVNLCHDLKPHTKYYYTMINYPDDIIITVDDDIPYDDDLIENLYSSYINYPNAVSAMRVHLMTFAEGNKIANYRKWKMDCSDYIGIPSMKLFATGVGGVLYPPHCMNEMLFDENLIEKLAPKADDVWLKFMQIINNTPVVLAKRQKFLDFIGDTQQIGLCYNNVQGGGNDDQINECIKYLSQYDIMSCLLKKDEIPPIYIYRNIDSRTEVLKQVNKIFGENEKQRKDIEKQRKDIDKLKRDLERSNQENKNINEILKANEEELEKYMYIISETRNSITYKLGRLVTFVPRWIRHILLKKPM